MKKKQIEKVPYLTLKSTVKKKGVNYVCVTALKNVAHERHFFLEVYENKKECLQVPVARIVCTKKDFATYLPEKDEWTRQKITTYYSSDGFMWENYEKHSRSTEEKKKKNVLADTSDMERIKRFFGKLKSWRAELWWEYIYDLQDKVVIEARRRAETRKYERRQQALAERDANTSKLDEKGLLTIADNDFFMRKHYLFYKKKGSYAQIACSCCGGVTKARWKPGISYESQFEKIVPEPREGGFANCPMCGVFGQYKPQGKVHSSFDKTVYVYLGQRYKETGFVMRYIELQKKWQLELIDGADGPEMYSALEELNGIEIARTYFEEGKEVQTDYHKHSPYTGRDFWDDCNLAGIGCITLRNGTVLPETYEEMKGTVMQYSCLKEYMAAEESANAIDYLEAYYRTPQIEMLMKFGLRDIVKCLVECRYGIVSDMDAKRLDKFLGIRNDKVKFLTKNRGDIRILKILQNERRLKANWSEEQIEKLAEIEVDITKLRTAMQIMSIQKMLNRVEKYAGCEFGTGCGQATARLKHTSDIYFDYLSMRQTLGYNMENTVYQQPRDIQQAHDQMVVESNKAEADKRLKEVAEKYPNIRKSYRTLRKKYFYEDDNFIIRPARSAEEIVMEGRLLHHCVGGNNYLDKHDRNDSIILMLRFKDKEQVPYITVEIRDEKIMQWYGSHDTKPDKENMQKWLDAYTTRLKCQRYGVGQKNEEEVMKQMLYA